MKTTIEKRKRFQTRKQLAHNRAINPTLHEYFLIKDCLDLVTETLPKVIQESLKLNQALAFTRMFSYYMGFSKISPEEMNALKVCTDERIMQPLQTEPPLISQCSEVKDSETVQMHLKKKIVCR